MEITVKIPVVTISYLPELPKEKNLAIDKLMEEWACQLVRRAVNQWLYEGEDNVWT